MNENPPRQDPQDSPPTDRQKLLAELAGLVAAWDQDAKDRHLDGMASSADALRGCRDELRAIIRRHSR